MPLWSTQPTRNPSMHPTCVALSAQIQEINHQHPGIKTWKECNNTNTALKNQLISAIYEQVIKSLYNCNAGYATSTTWYILDFVLKTNYGNITPAEVLLANTERLTELYNPAEPTTQQNQLKLFSHALKMSLSTQMQPTLHSLMNRSLILEYVLFSILKISSSTSV
jgi:hypothetical protein